MFTVLPQSSDGGWRGVPDSGFPQGSPESPRVCAGKFILGVVSEKSSGGGPGIFFGSLTVRSKAPWHKNILRNSSLTQNSLESFIKPGKRDHFTFGGWAFFVRTEIPSSAVRKTLRAS